MLSKLLRSLTNKFAAHRPAGSRRDLSIPAIPDAVKSGDAHVVLDFIFRHFESQLIEGGTPRDLESAAASILDATGSHGYFKGYNRYPSILCVSFNEETVHTPPSNRPFRSGDLIKIEFGLKKHGQHAFLGWTYPIGEISAAKQRLIDGAKAALEAGTREVKEGNRVGAISKAIQKALDSVHFVPSRDYVGYQIGEQPHMSPQIPCYYEGDALRGPLMRAGQKLAILVIAHPECSKLKVLGNMWTVVSQDGKPSALFSSTIEVLPEGGKPLTSTRSIHQ